MRRAVGRELPPSGRGRVGPEAEFERRAMAALHSTGRVGLVDWYASLASSWLEVEPTDTAFVIEIDGVVVGSIQCSEEPDPDYRHAVLDLFVDTAHQGGGLGPDAIRTAARWLIEERGHHRLTIDPSAANERAIAAYRRVGFRPVGVMRRYERGPDGTWHDGLLMDLLADELV